MKEFPIETPDEATPVYVKKMAWSEKTVAFVTWFLDVFFPFGLFSMVGWALFMSGEEADMLITTGILFMFWLPQWLTHHAQLELRRDIKWGPWMKALTVFYACVAALVLTAVFKKPEADKK